MGRPKRRRPDRPANPRSGRLRAAGLAATVALGVCGVFALSVPGPRGGRGAGAGHDHPAGPHGGAVVAIDRDNRFHAEAVAGPDGSVRLYTSGRDPAQPVPVAASVVSAAARDGRDEYAVMFRPDPLPGDPPGAASRFAGRLPPAARRGRPRLVVWSLPIGGGRFRFEIDPAGDTPDPAAAEAAARAEAALHATPGGRYTDADIRANGAGPASAKFCGERPAHDHDPVAGEVVCPVSKLRPDPRFVWVVGDREYRFCRPPCVDEFVALAKDKPGEVREPDAYRND